MVQNYKGDFLTEIALVCYMVYVEKLVEQLLRSPKLAIYLAQINDVIVSEKTARNRFYETVDEDAKAEFINGEVVYHSPVQLIHGSVRSRLNQLVDAYVFRCQLGKVGGPRLMISLTRNDYEPDVSYWRMEISQTFKPSQLQFPPPDWIAEVLSESTEHRDRGVKFEDYAAHGVKEYWIVDPDHGIVEQYLLGSAGEYELHIKADSGSLRCTAIAGLELPVAAIFDDVQCFAQVQAMLSMPTD